MKQKKNLSTSSILKSQSVVKETAELRMSVFLRLKSRGISIYCSTTTSVGCFFPKDIAELWSVIADVRFSGRAGTGKMLMLGENQINNSRPGRSNLDATMTKDMQGRGQQWRTLLLGPPPSICKPLPGNRIRSHWPPGCSVLPLASSRDKAVVCY